jgi:transposase InsO family protein
VIDVLSDLFILRGVPGHIRSDNGPEFIAKAVRQWITAVGAKTAYIAPGSPWENGFIESFMYRRPRGRKRFLAGSMTSVGCVHVYGLFARPYSWSLALMEFADRGLINGSRSGA